MSLNDARTGPALLARLAGVLAFEVAAVVSLHWAGHYRFLQVPFGDLDRWLSDAPAEDVLAAVIRLVGLAVAYWVLGSTVLYAAGLLAGRSGLLRSMSWVMLPGARRVLDGVVALSITGSSLTASLPAASASSVATPAEPAPRRPLGQPAAPEDVASKVALYPQSVALPPPPPGARTHRLKGGESFVDVAADHLGDQGRWSDIWRLNAERFQAAGLTADARPQIGWTLVLPGQPPGTQPPPTRAEEPYIVQPGDNLWTIAETELGDHLQRPPADEEIAPYWHDTIDANRDRIASGNPDLIYPGEALVLPPPPGDHPAPQPAPPNGSSTPPPTAPAPPLVDEAPPSPATTTPTDSTTTTGTTGTPTTATTAPGTTLPPTTAGTPTTAPSTGLSDGAEDDGDSPLTRPGVLAAAGISTALAGLTLHALARRRRARRRTARPGTETPARSDDDFATELALADAATDAFDRAWQAAHHLRLAFPDTELPAVTGLVVAPTGDVAVHLRNPTPPTPPFTEVPGTPSAWLLPAGTDPPQVPNDAAPLLETVVAVGRTSDESWVFLDLESLGAVTIGGDPTHAAGLARSIAAELALQPADHYVDVMVAGGLEPPTGTEHQGVQVIDRLDETLARHLTHIAEETATYLSTEGVNTTATGRARGVPRDGLTVTAVLVNHGADPVLVDRLAEAALPGGRGLAVVALDSLNDPATQLAVSSDGTLDIPHLGLTATAAGLDIDELRELDDLIQREPERVTPSPRPAGQEKPATLPTMPDWAYQVRLLAGHRVERADGTRVTFKYGESGVPNRNTTRGAELLSYLALRPGRSASLDEIRDHLWWGKDISSRTADTLVSGTRQRLGGGDFISHAEGEPGHKRYRLQPTVVTDLDLLQHDLAHAHAIVDERPHDAAELLRHRLAGIEHPAFHQDSAGAGLADWADATRVTDRIQQLVIDAALLAADLYTAQGPQGRPNARFVIDQALIACPDNEALTRTAMQLDALSGHRESAHRRYIALARTLARDELEPEPETTELHREIMSPG